MLKLAYIYLYCSWTMSGPCFEQQLVFQWLASFDAISRSFSLVFIAQDHLGSSLHCQWAKCIRAQGKQMMGQQIVCRRLKLSVNRRYKEKKGKFASSEVCHFQPHWCCTVLWMLSQMASEMSIQSPFFLPNCLFVWAVSKDIAAKVVSLFLLLQLNLVVLA